MKKIENKIVKMYECALNNDLSSYNVISDYIGLKLELEPVPENIQERYRKAIEFCDAFLTKNIREYYSRILRKNL